MLAPQSLVTGKPWLWMALAMVAIAAASSIHYLATRTGQILVSVTGGAGVPLEHAAVFVDDEEQKTCANVPCLLGEQTVGSHTVKVTAKGFAASPHKPVRVRGSEQVIVRFVLDALPSLGLKVGGTQRGVLLFVDGQEVGELPQEVHGLGLGSHQVLVTGRDDSYRPMSRTVELEPGKLTDLGVIKLKVVRGLLNILPGPIAADRVTLLHGAERKDLPALPMTLTVPVDAQLAITASKKGYPNFFLPINFDDGEREQTYTILFAHEFREPGDQRAPGPMTAEQVQVTVARYSPSLKRACWANAFDARSANAGSVARVNVALTIAPSGSVINAVTGADPDGYRGLANCISARVRSWQFSPIDAPTTVNVPFVFIAADRP